MAVEKLLHGSRNVGKPQKKLLCSVLSFVPICALVCSPKHHPLHLFSYHVQQGAHACFLPLACMWRVYIVLYLSVANSVVERVYGQAALQHRRPSSLERDMSSCFTQV